MFDELLIKERFFVIIELVEIRKELLPKSKAKLTIKLSSPEMRGFFDRVYKKLAPQVQIEGFRPGSAPRSMILSAIGENRINSEIVDLALQESYPSALKKENLLPIAPPVINIKMLKDLTADTAELEYEAEIDLLPKVELGDYTKIKAHKKLTKNLKASDEEIERVISHLARQQSDFKSFEGPLEESDRLEMNFEGFEKGVKLENLSSKNYPVILGSKVLIPEFEKKLIGLKKGEKREFSLEMSPKPEDKKRKIDFKVEVLETQKVILPQINDDFAKKFQKPSVAELKKSIAEDIIKQKREKEGKEIENEVLEGLLRVVKVDVPESLIRQEIEREVNEMRSRVSMFGLTFEQYLGNLKKSLDEFKEGLRPQAERTIKIGLALGEIVKYEKIDPKDKEAGKKALEKLISLATK